MIHFISFINYQKSKTIFKASTYSNVYWVTLVTNSKNTKRLPMCSTVDCATFTIH